MCFKSISVEGRLYVIECSTPLDVKQEEAKVVEVCAEVIKELQQKIVQLKSILEERLECMKQTANLFVSKDDNKQVEKYGKQLCKQMENLDIKLINAAQLME